MIRDRPSTRLLGIVLGCGEVGSAVAWTLDAAGLAVVLVDEVDPAWHRRGMSFTNAWYIGNAELEGKGACFCASVKSIPSVLARGMIAATTWSWPGIASALAPVVLVDTRRRGRRGTEALRGRVGTAIGIGPGFVAGESVDLAFDTPSGMECVAGGDVRSATLSPVDGDPSRADVAPHVVSCSRRGRFATGLRIGAAVRAGQVVGAVDGGAICAPASGVLLGLTARGARVEPGDELVEIHAERMVHECFGIPEGARGVAATVLSAIPDLREHAPRRRLESAG